jgi:HEAT repeat protein
MEPASRSVGGARHRRRETVVAGHRGDEATARRSLTDPEAIVRAAAVGALARLGALRTADVLEALGDPDPAVRRRACLEAGSLRGPGSRSALPVALRACLGDPDPVVVESAAWTLGERKDRGSVTALSSVASEHHEALCREGAVAALGAIGDPAGLAAVLARLDDRPPVRRRAVVALAAFEGPDVERALRRCLEDRDWQVRQAAEALLA